jgi:hypothetical protein
MALLSHVDGKKWKPLKRLQLGIAYEQTEPSQASSSRYLLVMVVTSVTIVPKSSRSDSAC